MLIHKKISGHGPDVVLLHGWGCDLRHMKPLADHLETYFKVTQIDLPGRGLSDWSESISSVDDMADLLLPHLPEKAIYIGWSFGGLVTISIGSRYTARVERMVGITTSPKFIEDNHWPGLPKPGFSPGFSSAMRDIGFVSFFKSFYDGEYKNFKTKPASYHALIDLLDDGSENDIDILLKGVAICDATDLRKAYEKLICPIDLIFGDEDSSLPTSLHLPIQALHPKARLHTISGAQHLPFWTHPEEFFSILDTILK